ncbi:hypothetical protein RJT34_09599 [Clitoria ternatea]|uniref:Uncharacterized protein n=1 Tax=Clitoria ternatea TaxID=43366 RepID=A0AAN9PUQ8_CLITE
MQCKRCRMGGIIEDGGREEVKGKLGGKNIEVLGKRFCSITKYMNKKRGEIYYLCSRAHPPLLHLPSPHLHLFLLSLSVCFTFISFIYTYHII